MKKLAAIGTVLALVGTLAACGNDGDGDGGSASDPVEFRLGTMYPEEHADVVSAQRAADRIEEETDGAVTIQIYPSNQLGDYTQVYEEVMMGTIDMATITIPSSFDSRLEMLTMPYLVTSFDEAKELFAPGSDFFEALREVQLEHDVETLNIYLDGFMGVGSTTPLQDPMNPNANHDQLIRVPPNESYLWVARAMGYNTTSIPYADLYSALQTGVADGWIGGSAYVNETSFGDVIEYFVDSRYIMELVVTVINKEAFDNLSDEQQEIIRTAFTDEALIVADEREALDNEAMESMAADGIEIYVPTQEELDAMAEHVRAEVWPLYEDILGAELLDLLMATQ